MCVTMMALACQWVSWPMAHLKQKKQVAEGQFISGCAKPVMQTLLTAIV